MINTTRLLNHAKEIKSENAKKQSMANAVYEEKQFMCAEKTNVSDCQNLIDAGCFLRN
ncbi:hypothetical protein [Acinetobacter baumannii]|uniref:hypothetical protein n=1 Tax=Acinetobacter baumannii TaxID=470 RepID=UPI003524AA2A